MIIRSVSIHISAFNVRAMGRKAKAAPEQSISAAFAKTAAAVKKAKAKPSVAGKAKADSVKAASIDFKASTKNGSTSSGGEKLTPAKRKEYKDASKECFAEALGAKSAQGEGQDASKRQCLKSAVSEVERKVVADVIQSTMEKSNELHPGNAVDFSGLGSSTNDANPAQAAPEPCAFEQVGAPVGAGDDDENPGKEKEKEDCPEAKTVAGDDPAAAANVATVHLADVSASKQCDMPSGEAAEQAEPMLPHGNQDESAVVPSVAATAVFASAASDAPAHCQDGGVPDQLDVKPEDADADVPMDAASKPSELDHLPPNEAENQRKEKEKEDCPEAKTVAGDDPAAAANVATVHLADVSASKQCDMPSGEAAEQAEPMLPHGNQDESAVVPSVAATAVFASAASDAPAHCQDGGVPDQLDVKPEDADADVPMDAASKPSDLDHAACGNLSAENPELSQVEEDYKGEILQELLEMSESERRSKIEWADMHEDLYEYNQFLKEQGLSAVSFGLEIQRSAGLNSCVPLSGFMAWLWERNLQETENDCGSEGSLTDALEKELEKVLQSPGAGRDVS